MKKLQEDDIRREQEAKDEWEEEKFDNLEDISKAEQEKAADRSRLSANDNVRPRLSIRKPDTSLPTLH